MKSLDLTRTLYTVSDFVSWQKNNTLVLSPSFQRRPVWKPGAKSLLIDTILRGLPIPIIFLRDQKTDLKTLLSKREVIDGQQRIRTMLSFICPQHLPDYDPAADEFTIKKVHNKELSNKPFRELPDEMQQRILDYQFSVHILPSSVDDREVLQIFARMNATGVKLNDQELRNASYFGEFKTLSYEISTEFLEQWRGWALFSESNIARMDEVELSSEFLMLMLGGLVAKSQASINKAYADFDESLPSKEELRKRFRHTMTTIESKLGDQIATSPFQKKTLFYSLFASIYHLAYGLNSSLSVKSKPNAISAAQISHMLRCASKIESQSAPADVLEATSHRTTHLEARKVLVQYLSNSKLK